MSMKVLWMEISEKRLAQSKAWRLGNIILTSQGFLLMTLEMAEMYFADKTLA